MTPTYTHSFSCSSFLLQIIKTRQSKQSWGGRVQSDTQGDLRVGMLCFDEDEPPGREVNRFKAPSRERVSWRRQQPKVIHSIEIVFFLAKVFPLILVKTAICMSTSLCHFPVLLFPLKCMHLLSSFMTRGCPYSHVSFSSSLCQQ